MSGDPSLRPRRFPWAALLFAVAGFVILLGLGTWQVQRLHWKEGLIQAIDQRVHSTPRPLADIEAEFAASRNVDYEPIEVRGVFDHGKERHFLATRGGASGFFVYTPLLLADGRSVFVNRGFVPYGNKDPATRPQGQVEGEITVSGLARDPLSGKPSTLVPDNEPDKNVFYWKDLDVMATSVGIDRAKLVPFFVDAGSTPNPGGLPVGGVTIVDLPNNHLQYAITWYGLAATLVVVFGSWLWRRRSEADPPQS